LIGQLQKQYDVEELEKALPEHDVCCVLCLEKGEVMGMKKLLGGQSARESLYGSRR